MLRGKKFYTSYLQTALAWALPLLATLHFFSRLMEHPRYMTLFFSADALYLPGLYRDLFVKGVALQDWLLPPAPYFFPDMPLFFLPRFSLLSILPF